MSEYFRKMCLHHQALYKTESLYANAKTHKFDGHSLINSDDLRFRPIID